MSWRARGGDAPQADALLEGWRRGEVGHVVADGADVSDAIRRRARALKANVCIKPDPRRRVKKRYDKWRYRHRNLIERFFARVKEYRRVATRYEKKAENFLGVA